MEKKTEKKEYVIDATGRALGRVASEVAKVLRGKDATNFVKHIAPEITVKVVNASRLDVSQKKLIEKVYHHYSGYPGGLKTMTLSRLVEKKGWGEAIKNAVHGMLPANRLRPIMMKNLIITD